MIDFGPFRFAGAPRTATTWIRHAADAAGLRSSGFVHFPHNGKMDKIRLSTVRRPTDWLRSYWSSVWPGQIQIDCVDGLRRACEGAETFDEFVRAYLSNGWSVGRMFASYGADVVIRVEDLPWAFIEFLESLGVEQKNRERCLGIARVNESIGLPEWNPSLRDRVLEAEWEMIERYDYDLI